ncbi:hypothetical protein [Amycolatopsis sp. CA-230715]|uniref:hypothetical protein n=1 Tax=Amycolatopsis sp. CA-230715 TaxID=2745196 RepID=UPI001C0346D8|nr:hypothetical protein [Amycolatopsis sp. CA-230715]QWF81152.1 hypothetical protein HUW46_04578 [Amycolatopsis sp. CA-230715]
MIRFTAGSSSATARALYAACHAGTLPAEVLSTEDRARLVRALWRRGWADVEIAEHTLMSTYTTARIRSALGYAPHPRTKRAA